MDAQRLKDNFARVEAHGQVVAEYFYADLFQRNPQLRVLFPASMARQHKVLLEALTNIVSLVDNPPELMPYLAQLGQRHRDDFGVRDHHYPEVGTSLIATLRYFTGDDWDADLESDWTSVYGIVSKAMIGDQADAKPVR
jgi:hemoglobin-like flavoprotein